MKNQRSKIVDNPSSTELLKDIKGAEAVRLLYNLIPGAKKLFPNLGEVFSQLDDIQKQTEILYLPDKFNEHFASRGWIAYESLNVEVMKEAISLAEKGKHDEAEEHLANYYNAENLERLLLRLQGIKEFRSRLRLIELAKTDYLEGRYHACIPLLLALIDGLVNDISKHVGFFAEKSDMTAWDSIAAHETGLQFLAQILCKNRTRTNEEKITIPYRNGILHGRELAFDNKLVAAKCWSTLAAVRDWAGSLAAGKKELKQKEEKSLIEILAEYDEILKQRKQIDEWQPRDVKPFADWSPKGPAEEIPAGTPERAVAEFIENWSKNRYDKLAASLLSYANTTLNKKAGEARRDFGHINPIGYEIIEIDDEASAISNVKIKVTYKREGTPESKEVTIRAVYQDKDSNPLPRGGSGGSWKINQAGFSGIIYDIN